MELLNNYNFKSFFKLSDIYEDFDNIFFDIWGVLHEGGELYPGVRELFNKIVKSKNVRIISNAPRLPSTICNNLRALGLDIEEDQIFTSGLATRIKLQNPSKYLLHSKPKILHIGADRNLELQSGIDLPDAENVIDCEIILISAFRDVGENINDLVHILELGCEYEKILLCANPDKAVVHLGQIRKCAGYFAEIYEKLGGKVIYAGKPGSLIFEESMKSVESKNFEKTLMIGDTFYTDIKGARNFGIKSALVTTGNMGILISKENDTNISNAISKICSRETYLPDYIIEMK